MSNFRRFIKSLNIDYGSFNEWAEKALNPKLASPHKALFESYDVVLRRVEVAHADLEAFVLRHIDKPDFKERLAKRGDRIEALERESVARLRRIFDAYLQDVKQGKS